MILRPYQQQAVDALYAYLRSRDGNPCVVAPTGSGKSAMMSTIAHDAVSKWNGRVLILAHVKELLEQTAGTIAALAPDLAVGVYSAGLKSRDTDKPVIVAGIQSVYRRACELDRFDLIIVDECFPTGTLISTPRGEMPIEDIYVGQSIYNATGTGTVEAISMRMVHELTEVRFENGKVITCTPNHPFFTDCGWTKAEALERGSCLFRREDLRMLRESILSSHQNKCGGKNSIYEGISLEKAEILFHLLLQETGKCHVRPKSCRKNASISTTECKEAIATRGKRDALVGSKTLDRIIRKWLDFGICDRDDGRTTQGGCPEFLQSGFGFPNSIARHRIGRELASDFESEGSRQTQDAAFSCIRVESVTHLKLQSPVTVFNLQVDQHPTYFANDVLVHNCHLLPPEGEGMYQSFLKDAKIVNPNVRLIGLTATPFRLKSGLLCGPDNLLNDICFEVGVKELIEQGFLCKLKTKSGRAKVDCSKLGIRAGEFITSEVDALVNHDELVASACREIIMQTEHRHAVLIFAVSVAHAERVKATLEKLSGLECGLVTGETPAGERERLIKRFKNEPITTNLFGSHIEPLRYLVNVNVLTTGFDAPNVDCVVMLRPTASAGLYYQMVGRGFRLHESKSDCLVLDYGGNILRHGPVDCIQVKDRKSGSGGETPMKECPHCLALVHAAIAACSECGYTFPEPEREGHDASASQEGILSGEVIDTKYSVRDVYYAVHTKKGAADDAPKTVRVDYRVGFSEYKSEWLCPEHSGWARSRFEKWWTARSNEPLPDTAEDAVEIALAGGVAVTTEITVRKTTGEKFDRIIRYEVGDKPEPVNWNVEEPAVPSQYASHSSGSPPDGRLTPANDQYDEVPF